MPFIAAIKSLYAIDGIMAIMLYVPQIIAAWKNDRSGREISPVTFGGWALGSFITTLYAWFVVKDAMFAAMSVGNTLGSGAVFVIVVGKRLSERRLKNGVGGELPVAGCAETAGKAP